MGGVRLAAVAAPTYASGPMRRFLAHSISSVRSLAGVNL